MLIFITVQSLDSAIMLSYTVTGSVIEYNTSGLSSTTCEFPASCSLQLGKYSAGERVRTLASLQQEDHFASLRYSTGSKKYNVRSRVSWAMLGLFILFFLILLLFLVCGLICAALCVILCSFIACCVELSGKLCRHFCNAYCTKKEGCC